MKNIKILFAFIIGLASFSLNAQVAVTEDGSSADGSAMLDVKSTTKGVLITRMTQSQRNSITSPATGLMIYQTDNTPGFYYYSGSSWAQIGGDVDLSDYALKSNVLELDNTTSFTPNADYEPATKLYVDGKASQWTTNGNEIYYNNNVGVGIADPVQRMHIYGGPSGQSNPHSNTQLTIESSGNSGISILCPSSRTGIVYFGDENSSVVGRIGYEHAFNRLFIGNDSQNSLVIHQSENISIGSYTDSHQLFVNGPAGGITSWDNTSDKRFKKNIVPISGALNKVMQIQGVTFDWDKSVKTDMDFDDKNHIGFLAQDLEEVLPQVVFTADDEMKTKSVAYGDVVPVLVEAIKEQQQQIEEQQNQISVLKQELEDLVNSLKK